jgi:hypothetical protein
MPYSMPLWIIFAKCPAPEGPTWSQPWGGASVSSAGFSAAMASGGPPSIMQ